MFLMEIGYEIKIIFHIIVQECSTSFYDNQIHFDELQSTNLI